MQCWVLQQERKVLHEPTPVPQQILPCSEGTQVAKAVRSESSVEKRPYLWKWHVITALGAPVRSRYPVFKEWGWKENSSKANQVERWHSQRIISQRDRAALSFNKLISWPLTACHSRMLPPCNDSETPPPQISADASESSATTPTSGFFWLHRKYPRCISRKWAAFQWWLRRVKNRAATRWTDRGPRTTKRYWGST